MAENTGDHNASELDPLYQAVWTALDDEEARSETVEQAIAALRAAQASEAKTLVAEARRFRPEPAALTPAMRAADALLRSLG